MSYQGKVSRPKSLPRAVFIVMALICSIALCSGLLGCSTSSGSSGSSGKNLDVAEEMKTPSLRDPGKMLTDEEMAEERKAMEFESYYRKWISDEEYMREWLNSGEQHEQWCVAMEEFIREIQNFSIADVPESDRTLYDQLLARVMDLRDSGV